MDKYDATLRRVYTETCEGRLQWEAVAPTSYGQIVLNADRAIRAVRTEMPLKDKRFPLLFVEKKELRHDAYGEPYDALVHELFVLDANHNLLLPLYDGLVDRKELSALAAAIFDESAEARAFFEALSEA
jgi:hypothetical protein